MRKLFLAIAGLVLLFPAIVVAVCTGGPPATAYLSAFPAAIPNGGSTVLTWDSTNAISCTSPDFSTGGSVGIGSITVSPTTTKTYTVNCAGSTAATASQTVTVSGTLRDAAAGVGTGGCTGSGTSASPWNYACIQNAVTAAAAGDTVFLRGGNWVLDSGDATFVSINKAGINLVGVGSGNTFDSYGHINNASGVTMCPTAGTSITCVRQTGTSYLPGQSAAWKGFIRFGLDGTPAPNCTNESVSNIFFDGSTTTAGGDYDGILAFDQCPGPITMTNIRVLTYQDPGFNGSTQLFVGSSQNALVQNSMLGNPLFNGGYGGGQAFESTTNAGVMLLNNNWWQGVYNPTFDDGVFMRGNTLDLTLAGFDPAMGPTGCGLDPSGNGGHICGANGGTTGTFHATFANNYLHSGTRQFALGGGVNDPGTTGNISDLHFTGNWISGTDVALASCAWVLANDEGNCATNGNSINAQADVNCNLSSSGQPYLNTSNSLIGTVSAQLNALGQGNSVQCYPNSNPTTGVPTPAAVFNYTGQNNYFSSPSNQYVSNTNTHNSTITSNFCAGGSTFTQTDSTTCATTGFTISPTVSFTLGKLHGTTIDFASTTFTAQYGAVKWLASTSSTTPTSSGQSGGAAWSFTPPVYLSGVAHGNTVYLWVMDSANNISSPASAPAPPPMRINALPGNFGLGMRNGPTELTWMQGSGVPWDYRNTYLNPGWESIDSPSGAFVKNYAQAGYHPVFTWYDIGGSSWGNPSGGLFTATGIQNASNMNGVFTSFVLALQNAAASGVSPIIFQIEPDLWGFMQQNYGDDATVIPVSVASSGYSAVASFANNAAGFAQALVSLRNTYAPSVILAWHVSYWGPNNGFDPSLTTFQSYNTPLVTGQRVAAFYQSLGASFDMIFHDPSDADSAYKVLVRGTPSATAWWSAPGSFTNYLNFIGAIYSATNLKSMLWQVPSGNTLYRSENNTNFHYQDNRPQYFLQAGNGQHILDYIAQGVIGLMFGFGGGTTDYMDAAGDGVTNPTAIDGNPFSPPQNTTTATVSDDDGGFIRAAGGSYYTAPVAWR